MLKKRNKEINLSANSLIVYRENERKEKSLLQIFEENDKVICRIRSFFCRN